MPFVRENISSFRVEQLPGHYELIREIPTWPLSSRLQIGQNLLLLKIGPTLLVQPIKSEFLTFERIKITGGRNATFDPPKVLQIEK
jgi:hypothetical protein